MPTTARRIVLVRRPTGWPTESDFRLETQDLPELEEGQVLLRTLWLSVDPYMRGRMRDTPSYAAPVAIGDPMTGGGVAQVIASRNPRLAEGNIVSGLTGWQDHLIHDGREMRKLDPSLAPVQTALGILGMPGLTAYFGIVDILDAKSGGQMLVSGAAGAVGSVAGQIGRILGCRVVGVAGDDAKVEWITGELGFDEGFNYKTVTDYRAELRRLFPSGIDSYFDNVGGALTDAALANLALHARVAICGQISQYNNEKPELGPRNLFQLIIQRARIEGFLVMDYAPRFREGLERLAGWYREGRLVNREHVTEGLENTPRAFIEMMQGANMGKALVKVAEPAT